MFNAVSPDQLALLNLTKFLDLIFQEMMKEQVFKIKQLNIDYKKYLNLLLKERDNQFQYKLQKTGEKYLFSRGADSILLDYERLYNEQLNKNEYHQLKQRLYKYGKIGLRTLVLSKKNQKNKNFRNGIRFVNKHYNSQKIERRQCRFCKMNQKKL
ncbi:unnamed protein product [Paramecium sonneborni]|uniref:Uncharacterized protein n=1 Tax=Paramecium sonneborni TaxID=65129 RepID=A0A8S1RMX2_9CILI|nr:unnamed protein product [Paramecium sonneborni]